MKKPTLEKVNLWLESGKTLFSVVGAIVASTWFIAITFPTTKSIERALAGEERARTDGDAQIQKEVERRTVEAQNNQKQILDALERLEKRIDRLYGRGRHESRD